MPVFFHIVFWAISAVVVVGGLVLVFAAWAVEFGTDDISDWLKERGSADPSNINSKNKWYVTYPVAGTLSVLIGLTLLWIIVLASVIQIAVILYGG